MDYVININYLLDIFNMRQRKYKWRYDMRVIYKRRMGGKGMENKCQTGGEQMTKDQRKDGKWTANGC